MTENRHNLTTTDMFAELIRELRRGLTQYIWYQIAFFIMSVIILSPVSSLIFAFLIDSTTTTSITNEYIISYFFSLKGGLTLSIWCIITFFLIFTEQSGIILICSKAGFREKTGVVKTITFAIRKLHIILLLGANLFLRTAVFTFPFLAICGTTYFTLLTDYDINYYYVHRPPSFWVSILIVGLSLIGYLFLMLKYMTRWIFILHLALLENEPVNRVFSMSDELVRGVGTRILKVLILRVVCIWAFITVTTAGYAFINSLILHIIGSSAKIAIPIMSFLYIFDFIISTLLILLISPVFSIVLTQLYYRRLHTTGLTVKENISSENTLPNEDSSSFILFQRFTPRVVTAMVLISVVTLGIFLATNIHKPDRVEVTAHRGSSSRAPENTLSAIRQAIADQADYAEIDVQETLDGVIVVLHDSDLMRVTGKKLNIWETTIKEVRKLDAGSWFSPEFTEERIPTLEEAIAVARGRIKLNIELKFYNYKQRLTERVVGIIRKENFTEHCIVMSTNYQELLKVKKLDNRIKTGFVFFEAIGSVFDFETDFFSIFRNKATESFISKAHNREKEVHVWLVNTPEAMEHLIFLGVDNIITDYPEKLVSILQRRAEMNNIDRLKENFMKWLKR